MKNQINLAIQILPFAGGEADYTLIDKAIELIQNSGLKYKVCPFETVVEGTYDKVMDVVKKAQEICYVNGATKMLVYLKIQSQKDTDLFFEDKLEKY